MKEEETLEEAAEKFIMDKNPQWTPYHKESFKEGAKWQAERMYTRDEMFLFAGFVQGKKYSNPEMDLTDIMEEWEKTFKSKSS